MKCDTMNNDTGEDSEPSLLNRLMSMEDLMSIFAQVSIERGPVDEECLNLYRTAFVHNSFLRRDDIKHTAELATNESVVLDDTYCDVLKFNPGKSYQCMEFLGDACIKAALSMYLYLRFPRAKEGFLTNMRIKIECKDNLSRFGSYLGFDKFLLLNDHTERKSGRTNPRFMEDTFESFCGALFLDLGYDAVYDLLVALIEDTIDFKELIMIDENYKSILLKHYHRLKFRTTPVYSVTAEEKGATIQVCLHYIDIMKKAIGSPFEVTIVRKDENGERCLVKQLAVAVGRGSTRKEAEQDVSRKAIDLLKIYK